MSLLVNSGTGLRLNLGNSILFRSFIFNKKYVIFDGSNYVDVSSFIPANVLDNSVFSISFWRKGTGGYVLGCKDSSADWFGIDLSISTQITFKLGNASNNIAITPNTTEWENVILTYNKSSVEVFVNNVSKGSVIIGDVSNNYSLNGMFVGGYNNGGTFASGFIGSIDEVAVFNKVLISSDRNTIVNGGTVKLAGDARIVSGLKAFWKFEETEGSSVIDWAG